MTPTSVWLQAAEQEAQGKLHAAHAQAESAMEELRSATAAAATAQADAASLRSELAVATATATDGASAVRTVHWLMIRCRLTQRLSDRLRACAP